MPADVIPSVTLAGTDVDGTFKPEFICVGALIGFDAYAKKKRRRKVSELKVRVSKTKNLLLED